MTTEEKLRVCTGDIYECCIKIFNSNGISPQLGLFILDSVYRQIQDVVLHETNKHLSQVTTQYEMLKASLNTEGEDNDGDTTQTRSV